MKKENFCSYEAYELSSDELKVRVCTLGATVLSVNYKGRELVLSYPDEKGYLESDAYICAFVGRVANRIGKARFSLNGKEYVLAANEGENQLHGGPCSYDKRRWTAQVIGENAVRMSLVSPAGDNGYPGQLEVSVVYSVEGSSFRIDFEGVSDEDTVYAPTSHMYFDLGGKGAVLEHNMWINSRGYLESDSALIPTGRVLPAEAEFDFSVMRRVERDYDHCFVLEGEHACAVEAGGIRMDMYTDFPSMQLYTSSAMGAPHGKNAGLAIEPQFYPDSPNHAGFPSIFLAAGEKFAKYASFSFKTL